ncbi:hypothetical protein OQA88_7433 [Cercophora sp. LCS_1]
MASPAKKASLTQIVGDELSRFVVQSTLLHLIDPVRGEPTRTFLDENPESDTSGGQKLKQKFLDSFALICSTSSSGAETASAVCLEQHLPAGAILRVARNRGLEPRDLTGLEKVLQILQVTARKEKSWSQAESEILGVVVELDKGRILSMAVKIEKHGIRNSLRGARSRLLTSQLKLDARAIPELRKWLESYPFEATSPHTWSPATMAVLIAWASQARWTYAEQLRILFGPAETKMPPWLDTLHKIARYRSAIKSMVKLAAKQPEVLAGIHIQDVKATGPRPFSLSIGRAPLLAIVKRLVGEDSGTTMEQLEKRLDTQDVEKKLRSACRLSLTLHAEMQLVVFYEGNPSLAPRMQYMGTSKKACFHCHKYLLQHPLGPQVSACHQKIYPTWMPPPYYTTPGKFRKNAPFVKLSREIENLTKQELKTALAAPRRPKNQDSTAGPSLTTTATAPTELGS